MMRRHPDRIVGLDVEIASRSPIAVCAIGLACFESGREVGHFHSLVRHTGRVNYTRVHGLTRSDLRDAPLWPLVWKTVVGLVGESEVVAYRAAFDRGALMAMCARHGLRMPPFRFVCAAKLFEQHHERPASLAAALEQLGLPFPGRPHDPLADARAAAALVLALRTEGAGGSIQVSKTPQDAAPATPHRSRPAPSSAIPA